MKNQTLVPGSLCHGVEADKKGLPPSFPEALYKWSTKYKYLLITRFSVSILHFVFFISLITYTTENTAVLTTSSFCVSIWMHFDRRLGSASDRWGGIPFHGSALLF